MIKVTGIALLLAAQSEAMDEKKVDVAPLATPQAMVETKENNKPQRPQTAKSPHRVLTRQHGTSQLEFIREMYDDSK